MHDCSHSEDVILSCLRGVARRMGEGGVRGRGEGRGAIRGNKWRREARGKSKVW